MTNTPDQDHLHEECTACGGCVHECIHRVAARISRKELAIQAVAPTQYQITGDRDKDIAQLGTTQSEAQS